MSFFQTVSEGNEYSTYISTSNLIEYYFCYLPFIYSPLFFLCIKNKINNGYRFLFFITLPYILSVITWYFNIYISNPNHYSSSGLITGVFGHMFMASYVIHGVFFIPIVAYAADFLLRKMLK